MQEGYIIKSVSISKKQSTWLKENHKSLSAIIRATLEKQMSVEQKDATQTDICPDRKRTPTHRKDNP